MKFAIIAAGEGSRLREEGIQEPKPLVPLHGEAMIDRLIRIFRQEGAEEVVIIANTLRPETAEHLQNLHADDIRLVIKSTPSSMHSFFELSAFLDGAPFCLTTVDTIFHEPDFAQYIRAFEQSEVDGMMAVTNYIDDESPLYVGVDEKMQITGFYDERQTDSRYISGGIYCLRPQCLHTLRRCMAEGQSRMRNFQRGLIADGFQLKAFPFSKILDIDHADDIRKAEAFLKA